MMIEIINRSSARAPRQFIEKWCQSIFKELHKEKVKIPNAHSLTVAFVDLSEMKRINREFRKKNKPTDILSFEALEPESFGELVLCPQVLKSQAKEHQLSYREEVGYMLIHGILHLLGYDHENLPHEAEVMFALQDRIFERLRA